jgi:hypothetical protein
LATGVITLVAKRVGLDLQRIGLSLQLDSEVQEATEQGEDRRGAHCRECDPDPFPRPLQPANPTREYLLAA